MVWVSAAVVVSVPAFVVMEHSTRISPATRLTDSPLLFVSSFDRMSSSASRSRRRRLVVLWQILSQSAPALW